jgi:hypothetical protein
MNLLQLLRSIAAITACLITGCAQMGTRQIDKSTTTRYEIDKKGQTNAVTSEVRETATRASGKAVLSGKNTFEGLDASQDGSAQGLKVKKAAQQTDGLTQAVQALQNLSDIARMMKGFAPSESAQQAPQPIQPTRTAPIPPRIKWKLVPVDDPSEPQQEVEQ